MSLEKIIRSYDMVLTEAAIIERLRRSGRVALDPRLEHALLIYDTTGRKVLADLYQEYIRVAQTARIPILVCAPTWRATRDRLARASVTRDVNADAVVFMQEVRAERAAWRDMVLIGGLLGCRNDCYRPDQSLPESEAEIYHAWQITRLAEAGVDFLLGATLPALPEAVGIARAMAGTGIPYLISFVVNRNGLVLDGSSLEQCMARIDAVCDPAPLGYMVNCSYPSFLHADRLPAAGLSRLLGIQANASALDHAQLDGSDATQAEDIAEWGDLMAGLNQKHGIKVLGGCCGTGGDHLRYLVQKLNAEPT